MHATVFPPQMAKARRKVGKGLSARNQKAPSMRPSTSSCGCLWSFVLRPAPFCLGFCSWRLLYCIMRTFLLVFMRVLLAAALFFSLAVFYVYPPLKMDGRPNLKCGRLAFFFWYTYMCVCDTSIAAFWDFYFNVFSFFIPQCAMLLAGTYTPVYLWIIYW